MNAKEQEHAALCEELRGMMRTAGLGRDINVRVAEGFIWRGCGDAVKMHQMPLDDLRASMAHLRLEVERRGVVAALCELTWWSDGGEEVQPCVKTT